MTFTSCNRKATETENQLLVETWDTPFGVPPFDRISTGDFAPALEQGMSLHNEQIDAIVTSKERPTFDNVMRRMTIRVVSCRVRGLFSAC